MIKMALRILMMPVLFLIRLILGSLAFITTVSSAVIGLSTSIFIIVAMVEFFIGYWQNGLALMVLAILASPIGLPAIANFLLKRLDRACTFVEGLVY